MTTTSRSGDPRSTQDNASREEHWREERHAAYDTAKGEALLLDPLRRFTTMDREIRSWPLFGFWTLVVGAAYYWVGLGYWDFRNRDTGELDWTLIGIYWLVCASVVWLCWPMPRPKSREGGGDAG